MWSPILKICVDETAFLSVVVNGLRGREQRRKRNSGWFYLTTRLVGMLEFNNR